MSPNSRLYFILSALCAAGYAWLGYQVASTNHSSGSLCLFKNLTSLPCPSCGITRAIVALLDGNLITSVMINPLGIIASLALLILPLWISFDLLFSRQTLAGNFMWIEKKLRNERLLYIPITLLVSLNWGWNILKGL